MPITRQELKRRLLEQGGISPDSEEDAAVLALIEEVERYEKDLERIDAGLKGVQATVAEAEKTAARIIQVQARVLDTLQKAQPYTQPPMRAVTGYIVDARAYHEALELLRRR